MPPSTMSSHQLESANNGGSIGNNGPEVAATGSSTNDDVFQMQIELTALRNKLKLLNSGTDVSELLDLLKERDTEVQVKDEQIRILNDKFHQITNGLAQIESERQSLRETNAKLESDNKKTTRHLNIREKEVMALVQRCAEQEEKIQESVGLRTSVNGLKTENAELKAAMATQAKDLKQMESIRKELNISEAERKNCKEKIEELERQLKEASESLDDKVTQLQSIIQAHTQEEERLRNELTREKNERENASVASQKAVSEMREELSSNRSELAASDVRIKECDVTILSLKEELSSVKESYESRIKSMDDEHTLSMTKLKIEHEEIMTKMDTDKDALVKVSAEQLEEKENRICSLEDEISTKTTQCQELESTLEKERLDNAQILKDSIDKREQVEQEKTTLSEKLQKLESDYAEQKQNISSLEKTLSDREQKIEMLENNAAADHKANEEHNAEQKETIERLEIETSRYEKENISLEKTAESLRRRLQLSEEQISAFCEEKENLSKKVADLSEQTSELEQIQVLLEEEKAKTASLTSDLSMKTSEAESLTSDLLEEKKKSKRSFNESAAEMKRLDEQLQLANATLTEQSEKMEETMEKNNATIESLSSELANWEEVSATLQTQFDELQKQSIKDQELSQKRQEALEADLQETRSDLEEKMGQIDDLSRELEESSDRVASLEEQVSLDKEKMDSAEMEAAEVVADLENHIQELRDANSALESLQKNQEKKHSQEMERMKIDLGDLRTAKELRDEEIQTRSLDLEEREKQIVTLTEKIGELEEKNGSCRAELDMLIHAQNKKKLEHKNDIAALELEIENERTQRLEDEEENKKEVDRLHQDLSQMDGQLNYQGEQLSKMQELLNHRTKLLGDMVNQNKDLEVDLQEARTLVADLQEESNAYIREKDETDAVLIRLRKEAEAKEVDYLMAIHHERQLREGIEQQLHDAQMAIETAKEEGKNLADLKKENMILKDKIVRQEAYLQRKIEKEKVLKDRALKGSERNITPAPSRITKSTSSRGLKDKDVHNKPHSGTSARTSAPISKRHLRPAHRDDQTTPVDEKVLTERQGLTSRNTSRVRGTKGETRKDELDELLGDDSI